MGAPSLHSRGPRPFPLLRRGVPRPALPGGRGREDADAHREVRVKGHRAQEHAPGHIHLRRCEEVTKKYLPQNGIVAIITLILGFGQLHPSLSVSTVVR